MSDGGKRHAQKPTSILVRQILERHEMSSRPGGITDPGGCVTGDVGSLVGERIYIYCQTAWGCMSAVKPENNSCMLSPDGSVAIHVHRKPSLCTFEFHAVEPRGFLRDILDVDLKEHFFRVRASGEGQRGFRRVDLGLHGQEIVDLFPCAMRSTTKKNANGNAPQTCRISESPANSGRPHPRRVPGHKNTQAEVGM